MANLTEKQERIWLTAAAHAMQALIDDYIMSDNRGQPKLNTQVADLAWDAADAMVAAYIKRGGKPVPARTPTPKKKPGPKPTPVNETKPKARRITDYSRRVRRASTQVRHPEKLSSSTAEKRKA